MPFVDLLRDTAFGQIIRVITKRKFLQYPEEKDPELWRQWVSEEKSANTARYGAVEPPEEKSEYEKEKPEERSNREHSNADSAATSQTRIPDDAPINETSGMRIDPEKGMDKTVIHFLPDDPGVCMIIFSP